MAMSRNSILGLSKDGFHRLSYCDWGDPEAPRVVVCAHGLTRNARDFDALARSMETRCRVICPDIVGRGQSDWLKDKSGYAYPQYLADMACLIARVTAQLAPDTGIDWVGTSLGGLIGMMLAVQARTPIRRLVLNDIGPVLPKAALERIAGYVGKASRFATLEEAERYIRTVSASFGPLTDEQWRHLTEHSVGTDAAGGFTLQYDPGIAEPFSALLRGDVSLWPLWDAITCPVLVLRGAESDLLLAETAEEMTRRGPRARLTVFAGVGHAPALMADEQIAAVHDFLFAPA